MFNSVKQGQYFNKLSLKKTDTIHTYLEQKYWSTISIFFSSQPKESRNNISVLNKLRGFFFYPLHFLKDKVLDLACHWFLWGYIFLIKTYLSTSEPREHKLKYALMQVLKNNQTDGNSSRICPSLL